MVEKHLTEEGLVGDTCRFIRENLWDLLFLKSEWVIGGDGWAGDSGVGTSPVPGSASSGPGSWPGVRSNSGKLSTSVARSTSRISRLIWWMASSSVSSTSTSQGKSTPSAASAVRITLRIKARWPSFTPGTSAVMGR